MWLQLKAFCPSFLLRAFSLTDWELKSNSLKFKLRPAPASVALPPPQGHLYLLKKNHLMMSPWFWYIYHWLNVMTSPVKLVRACVASLMMSSGGQRSSPLSTSSPSVASTTMDGRRLESLGKYFSESGNTCKTGGPIKEPFTDAC